MNTTELIGQGDVVTDWISAIAATATALITGYAVLIARKTLHSWKDKEKFMQLVKVNRAVFAYRQKVESMSLLNHDHDKIREYVQSVLQPSLSDIFHEMKLAGMEENNSEEFRLFAALFEAQQKHQESHAHFGKLLDSAVALQKAVTVSF